MSKRRPAIAYLRVSTSKQGSEGNGLKLQRTAIDAYAQETNFTIVQEFRDVHTGVGAQSLKERRELAHAMTLARG